MALKLFVDFDGTVAAADVGNSFFLSFGGEACGDAVKLYREGSISARECYAREVKAVGLQSIRAVENFVDAQTLDPGFAECVAFCRSQAIPVCVVSDGLDYYIDRILARYGITGVPRYANHMVLQPQDSTGDGSLALSFPFGDAECTHCAMCKRNIMLSQAGEEDIIVYVGDGHSDRCPVQYADVVFAKKGLQTFCREQNISYFVYDTFHDVTARLRELLGRKKLRPRHRAAVKRRQAFSME